MKRHLPPAGVLAAQAPQLAHALLHHPRAWPRQGTALGLLVSLRKFYQTEWVRPRSRAAASDEPAALIHSQCCRMSLAFATVPY